MQRISDLRVGAQMQAKASFRTAVIAHVFYQEAWLDLRTAITNIMECGLAGMVDVFITYPEAKSEIREMFADAYPNAKIEPVANRGWDGWPFIKFLNEIDLPSYDYVVKLHSKRDVGEFWVNFHRFKGNEWRRELLRFCLSLSAAKRTFAAFAKYQRLGMVAGERMIDPISGGTWRPSEIRKQEAMLQGIGLMPRRKTLVYGTMFAIRASLLIPIWRRYCEEDFAAPCSENPHRDYGLAGDLEIMFGLMVFAQGYYVSSCMLPVWTAPVFYPLKGALFRLMRFFSDAVRIMRNGHV